MSRRRTSWMPAPVTPGRALPALVLLSVVVGALATCAAALIWAMVLHG